MITIITGTPGAGKTLYAVTKLVAPLIGSTVTRKLPDGSEEEVPRRIFTNIKGFVLDHELIDGSATGGLRNWQEWAKPGDVIVFDEVQEIWKPRANGSAVPADIQALETHRHMGVDFILITQGINLTERNLSMLCGRHLHVRRVANMPFAVVYEWDAASRTLLYSKAMAQQKWWYDRKGYKLYKSAELHTKAPRRLPSVVWLLLFAVIALSALAPVIYTRYGERFGWTKPVTLPGAPKPAVAASGARGEGVVPPVLPASSPASGSAVASAEPVFAGCARAKGRCTCFDTALRQVEKPVEWCEHETFAHRPKQTALDGLVIPDQERHVRALARNDDYGVLALMSKRAEQQRAASVKR